MNPKAIRCLLSVWVLGLCLGLVSMPVHAQVSGATLSGTITDPQGGAVPNAKVSARNVATGVSTDTETNGSGLYSLPNLPAADYEISVTAQGFSTAVAKVTLTVGQKQELNIPLAVGQVEQSVQVTTEAPQVELESSTISSEVSSTTVRELPLNGRDWASLATLQPSVIQTRTQLAQADPQHVGSGGRGFGDQLDIGGGRPTQNSYRLDGAIVNDYSNAGPGSVLGANLGVDAVQEFNVLTSNYSAEYGFTSGGVINAVTKSGTNSFHGTGFDFLRNSDLDARDFFTKVPTLLPKNILQQNQFGGAAGYRILKDKLFLFGNYEGVRRYGTTPVSGEETISDLVRGGTVTSLTGTQCSAGCSVGTIDPTIQKLLALYPEPNCGPVKGNPNAGCFSFVGPDNASENFVTGRFDYKASDKDSLFFTYVRDSSLLYTPLALNILTQETTSYRQAMVLEETHVFNASWVNTVRVANDRTNNLGGQSPIADNPVAGNPAYGEIGTGAPGGYGEYNPSIALTGTGITGATGGIGSGASIQDFWGQIFQVYDDAFHQAGSHSLKFGGMFLAYQDNGYTPLAGSNGSGTFSSNGFFNGSTNVPTGIQGSDCYTTFAGDTNVAHYDPTCSSLVNFLTNQPNGAGRAFDPSESLKHYLRDKIVGLYLQDDWKARRNLTLNLGIRYEPSTLPTEINGQIFQMPGSPYAILPCEPQTVGAPLLSLQCPEPSVQLANQQGNNANFQAGAPQIYCGISSGCPAGGPYQITNASPLTALSNKFWTSNTTLLDFEPRLGFAWDIFGDGKTALRGGIGVFDSLPLPYIMLLNSTSAFPGRPNHLSVGNGGELPSPPSIAAGTAATAAGEWPYNVVSLIGNAQINNPLAAPGGFYDTENYKRNYVYQFNLSIQRQLTADTTITIAYNGSRAYHNPFQADTVNTVLPVNVQHPIPGVGYYWQGCTPSEMGPSLPGYTINGLFAAGVAATVPSGSCSTPGSANNIAYEWVGAANQTTITKDARNLNPSAGSMYTTLWQAQSWYDALSVNLVKRMSHGIQIQSAFTWSHSIDDMSGSSAGDTFDLAPASSPWWDQSLDKGNSEFNVGLNWVVNGEWLIPTPKNWGAVAEHLAGGWEVGGIFTAGTGVPTEPNIGQDTLGENVQTLNPPFLSPGCTPQSAIDSNYRNDLTYYNTTQTGAATLGCLGLVPQTAANAPYCDATYVGRSNKFPAGYCPNIRGDLGRDVITGPGLMQLNGSIFKNNYIPRISEAFNIQFRCEIFNLTNHENFAPPTGGGQSLLSNTAGVLNTGSGGWSQITSTQGTDREIQLALKVIW